MEGEFLSGLKVSLARTQLVNISVTFCFLIKGWCLQERVCCNKEVFCWVHPLEDGRQSGKEQVMRHSSYYRKPSVNPPTKVSAYNLKGLQEMLN